jgi:HK97 family phage major capsid protein
MGEQMNVEQMKARLLEIVASLEVLNKDEVEASDVETVANLKAEFEDLSAKIKAKEDVAEMLAAANKSERKVAPKAVAPRIEVKAPKFANSGEFFKAVKNAATSGRVDERLMGATYHESNVGEEGGFLIPEDTRQAILEKVTGDQSLLPLTTQLQTASNSIVLPTKENAPWDASFIQAYWTAEGGSYTPSKFNMGQSRLELHKLTAMANVTEELLSDAPLLESYLKAEAPKAFVQKINEAIISGDGVGKIKGFLNSGFKYQVAKEGAQGAATVLFENIVKMWSRLAPGSAGKAVWLVNPQVLAVLPFMKFDTSATNPVPVYIPAQGIAGAPYGTLLGRPVLPLLGSVKALGTEGDISLVDLSYLTTVTKTSGINQQMSIHAYWDKDITSFKFSMRIGGDCLFKSPIQTQNGSFQMSGFVTLADRA